MSEAARERFFLGVARASEDHLRDDYTLPLFPLALILEADGTLAAEARPLFERYQA